MLAESNQGPKTRDYTGPKSSESRDSIQNSTNIYKQSRLQSSKHADQTGDALKDFVAAPAKYKKASGTQHTVIIIQSAFSGQQIVVELNSSTKVAQIRKGALARLHAPLDLNATLTFQGKRLNEDLPLKDVQGI